MASVSHREVFRCLLLLASALLPTSCQVIVGIEDTTQAPSDAAMPDAQTSFVVRGVAYGLLAPVSLELRYDGGTKLLSIVEDRPFAFPIELQTGDSYAVVVVGEPPCVLNKSVGVIAAADPEVELACEGVFLDELVISGPTAPALTLDPAIAAYEAEVSVLHSHAAITAVPRHPGGSIAIDGVSVASGIASEPVPLDLDETNIEVTVTGPGGGTRAYQLTVRRTAEITQAAYGKASNAGVDDQFGVTVALSGDLLAVGAWLEDSAATGIDGDQSDNTAGRGGAVYVFRRDGSIWSREAYLKASNTDAGDEFGISVALSGDTLAVGAHLEDSAATGIDGDQGDNAAEDSGAVYVFRRSGISWAQEAYLKASHNGAGDEFGESIALSGDTLAIAARLEDSAATGIGGDQSDNNATDSGAVYVFRRSGTSWSEEAYLKASNTDAGDLFGESVTLSGDLLAVGASLEDSAATGIDSDQGDNSAADSGAVYVFRRSGTNWTQEAYLKSSNTDANDNFGVTVAMSGDTLAVGARLEDSAATGIDGNQDDNAAEDSGAVYVFRRSGTNWIREAYLKASNSNAGDDFGQSMALSGDTLAVDARLEDGAATGVDGDQTDNTTANSGAVYVFH